MTFALRSLLVLTALLPVGCQVVARADVSSEPHTELKFRLNADSEWTSVKVDTQISIHKKTKLTLYGCAEHRGGIGLVMLNGSGTQRCNTMNGPVLTPYAFYAENRATAQVGEMTPEGLMVLGEIEMKDLCDLGGPAGSVFEFQTTALLFNPTISGSSPTLTVTLLK